MKLKRNKGITLVALIITIIILLILAVVAIRSITGDGILQKAREAADATARGQVQEELDLAISNLIMEETIRNNMSQEEKAEWLQSELQKQDGNTTVNTNGNGFNGIYKDYNFNINDDYKVTIGDYAQNDNNNNDNFSDENNNEENNDSSEENNNEDNSDSSNENNNNSSDDGNNNGENSEETDNNSENNSQKDLFIWKSDDPSSEDYGTIIGYTEKIQECTVLRYPERCTKISLQYDANRYGSIDVKTSIGFTNNLTKIEIPGNVKIIEENKSWYNANGDMFKRLSEVLLEEGVTSIGNYAFYNCNSLTNITIPNGVTTIGSVAFGNCNNIQSIEIPESVTTIGWGLFFTVAV